MRQMFFALLVAPLLLVGCGDPKEIVLGPEPMKQLVDQGDKFKKLSQEERELLVGYLGLAALSKTLGGEVKTPTGRTVGEVLVDARAWRERVRVQEAEAKKREEEAAVLRAKVMAERDAVAKRISESVVVAVVGKKVLPKNYDVSRFSSMLVLTYAIENRAAKGIKQLKGRVVFKDLTGDLVGDLPTNIDQAVDAGKTLRTDTGRGWNLNEFRNGDIEKIAATEFEGMTAVFEPESLAFDDGEVLKAPSVSD